GGETRRPAAGRDRARQIGPGKTGSAGPRPDCPRAGRRLAPVRRALARRGRECTAERGRAGDGSRQGASPRRDVAARGAGSALQTQDARGKRRKMKRLATLLVWLAL